MKARAALRAATAAEHERVDRLFSGLDLSKPEGYRAFLTAQAAAHLPAEDALEAGGVAALIQDWPQRRRSSQLRADLAELGAAIPEPIAPPALADAPAMLGALYVLEGSRLGGALLKRGLPEAAPRRFLDAEQEPGAWRKLLAKLDDFLYEPVLVDAASQTAREIFARFELAGRRYVESGIVERSPTAG